MCVEYTEDCGYGTRSRESVIASAFFVKQEFELYDGYHKPICSADIGCGKKS